MRHAGECPDLESIAAYLDNRLSAHERARMTEHLASCEECYAVFREAAQTDMSGVVADIDASREGRPRWRGRTVAWSSAAAGLATAAAVWLVVGTGVIPWRPADREMRALVAAVGTDRPIEARLTGGFAYGALRGALRGAEPESATVSPDVRIAAAQIEKDAAASRTVRTLNALGIASLVVGDVNRGVLALEEAADVPYADAQVLTNLSAAYLARATRNNQPQDFARALTMADRAVKSDPRLAEAWFNRACALRHLSLADQERQAWQDYLKVDDRSGWAGEARTRLKEIAASTQSNAFDQDRRRIELAVIHSGDSAVLRSLVERSPDAARVWAEEQLLIEWPRLVLEGHAADARLLVARVQRVAGAMAEARGDAFLRDVTASAAAVSGSDAESLAKAHQLYRATADAYDADRIADSATLAVRTIDALAASNSPLVLAAVRYHAIGEYFANNFSTALADVDRLIGEANRRGYRRLLGLAQRLTGLIHVIRGEYASGLDAYQAALASFRASGDVENEAAIQTSLAEDLEFVGETRESWHARFAALSLIPAVRDPLARYRILQYGSQSTLREDLPEAALHLQQAALDSARTSGRSPAVITGYLNRAAINNRLGRATNVTIDLEDAQRFLTTVKDPLLVSRNQARILLVRGETLAQKRPTEAIAALDDALRYFEQTRTSWPLASVYLARGRARLAAREATLAETDFLKGIHVFEEMRARLGSDSLRTSYFEQPWDLFTEMIRLQADRHDAMRALTFAERARARTLLEAVDARANAAVVDASGVQRVLPPGAAVVYYASLDDRLLMWVLTRTTQDFISTPIRQQDLARLVERWRSDRSADAQTSILTGLYDLLVRPLESSLPDQASLIVVPDGVLHAVPFAALVRRETRRYLVEDHPIAITPSLTLLERSTGQRSSASPLLTSALVIGNPSSEGSVVSLPEADREAREIATLYPTRQLLMDADASKAKLLQLANTYDVVHFAGHGVSNDDYPSLSRLLLAGADESERSLFAHEIATLRLERPQLVVLAACRTSAGRIRRGEGVLSLARPFLAAGVPTVVASLWDVDDRASHTLFVAFHRGLRRGLSVVDALRDAQLGALAENDPVLRDPSNWATFVVVGGAPALVSRPPSHTS